MINKNIPCLVLLDRLRTYISMHDVCNYIGIQLTSLNELPRITPSDDFLPEKQRNRMYHLAKIKHYIQCGIDKPIDLDSLSINGSVKAHPVIIDGRHRYLAALLRRDKTIPATYSGREDAFRYLTGKSNYRPL